jgi:hypothetical protein
LQSLSGRYVEKSGENYRTEQTSKLYDNITMIDDYQIDLAASSPMLV